MFKMTIMTIRDNDGFFVDSDSLKQSSPGYRQSETGMGQLVLVNIEHA